MKIFQDYLDLLQCLNANKVKYLVIGGYAVIQYAEPRYTKDIDFWVEPSMPNAKKLLNALNQFGAPTDNLTIKELTNPGLVFVFGIPPLRVDILNNAQGCKFETAWKNKNKVLFDKVNINFISKNDLIKLKKKANSPQDIADINSLKKSK